MTETSEPKKPVFPKVSFSVALAGFFMNAGALLYGDSLLKAGVPCDTDPLNFSTCIVSIGLFWLGAILLGIGFVATIYVKRKRFTEWFRR